MMSRLLSVLAICCWTAPALADCSDLYDAFGRDLAAWAAATPDVQSINIGCDGGVLVANAVADTTAPLVYTPGTELLAEAYPFFGLAAYYNSVRDIEVQSDDRQVWSGWKGRFAAVLVSLDGASIVEESIELQPQADGNISLQIGLIGRDGQGEFAGITADELRYTHLWGWLRGLCLLLEKMLVGIHGLVGLGWGFSIILLNIVITIVLIPVTIFVTRQQRKVGSIQAALEAPLQDIKANYDGQEAHERIMAAHKELGVSPFYTLRPMLGMLIQVPILIAVFNMLGEVPVLSGEPFLWISDLAYPDAVWQFMPASSGIPLVGNTLNLLPILMTVITISAAIFYKDSVAPSSAVVRQKRNLYFMAIAFLILFYPFPAAMVLYWATANVLQFGQQLAGMR